MPDHKVLFIENSFVARLGFGKIMEKHMPSPIGVNGTLYDDLQDFLSALDEYILIVIGNTQETVESIVKKIRQANKSVGILIFTDPMKYDEVKTCLVAGANGYLNQYAGITEILTATSEVFNNGRYLCKEILEYMTQETLTEHSHRSQIPSAPSDSILPMNGTHNLSRRQLQIIQHTLLGLSVSEIGVLLKISASTVATHKSIAFKKLAAKSVAELIDKYSSSFGSKF